jgi:hypothetical protein
LAAALKAKAASAQTNPPMAASISGIVQSFPAAVFIACLLIKCVTCMPFFPWKYDDKRRGCCGKNRELTIGIREYVGKLRPKCTRAWQTATTDFNNSPGLWVLESSIYSELGSQSRIV